VKDDKDFVLLYRGLWYRHYYSRLAKDVNADIRSGSWKNYCSFFDYLLVAKKPVSLCLPAQWLWDMIDEYIYQFQEFKSRQKSGEETASGADAVWDTVSVFKYLHKIIEKSNIKKTLAEDKDTHNNDYSRSQLYTNLGYWSIIGMCRLNVILGDYYLALKTLDPIQIHKKARYTQVTAAHISLYYYLGFAYMMLRRYNDSIKTFVTILLFISRIKQFQSRPYDVKKSDQMYTLLAILLTICPKRIDEHVNNTLKQDHAEVLTAMAHKEAEQLFSYACPKFVLATVLSTEGDEFGAHSSALDLQRSLFMKEIHQQSSLPVILSYLKLYSSIDLNKLANLLENKTDQDTLRNQLLCLNHKSRQYRWSPGMPPADGPWQNTSSLDFWIEGDMIHIIDNTKKKKFARTFLRNADKLEEITREVHLASLKW